MLLMKKLLCSMALTIFVVTSVGAEPRGIRNNNPLNIVDNGIEWNGKVDCSDRVFNCFDSAFHGTRAAVIILHTYRHIHGITTISGVVERWSPPHENHTEAYISFVQRRLKGAGGVGPHNLHLLLEALIEMENGIQPYSREMIRRAVDAGISYRNIDAPGVWFTSRVP